MASRYWHTKLIKDLRAMLSTPPASAANAWSAKFPLDSFAIYPAKLLCGGTLIIGIFRVLRSALHPLAKRILVAFVYGSVAREEETGAERRRSFGGWEGHP